MSMQIGNKLFKLAQQFRVNDGKSFRLKSFDPNDTCGLDLSKADARALLQQSILRLQDMQDKLYAQNQWAVLLIFQAMDAAGKDGVIKHVMSGLNPQGCQVSSFKQPSHEELDHDFLWRTSLRLPSRGSIGVFNRSYYEEVLVVRVHKELLLAERLPNELVTKDIWKERCEDIRNLEKHLTRNGTVIRKFFLNISREEQRQRFLKRLQEPEKNWKFSDADVQDRQYWDQYIHAYEETIRLTATPDEPWYVIPANHKWLMHMMVSAVIIETLESLDLHYPKMEGERLRQLESARKALEAAK
jgi:PPK2 family polyphosphate:nucleotide phosphotransferase